MTLASKGSFAAIIAFFVAAVFVATLPTPVAAQNLSRILGDSRLTPQDVEIATATAQELYTKPGVRAGDMAEWSNEDTGARGIVEITKVDQGGDCVAFRHTTMAKANRQARSANRLCRQPDNTWVFTPE